MIPHPGQQMVLNSTMRYRIVATGRRWGKDELLHMVTSQYKLDEVLYICVDYKHGEPFYRTYSRPELLLLTQQEVLQGYRVRGLRPAIILIDEPAWMSPATMDELWRILIRGAKLLAVGTPIPRKKGETDLLIELFRFAQQKQRFFDSDTWNFSSRINPAVDIPRDTIEALTEDQFRAEILGEFVTVPEVENAIPKYDFAGVL